MNQIVGYAGAGAGITKHSLRRRCKQNKPSVQPTTETQWCVNSAILDLKEFVNIIS